MFAKLFAAAAFASLAALAVPAPNSPPAGSQCNTGAMQCCETTTTASDPRAGSVLTLLNIVVQDVNVPVGLKCSPITAVAVGSGQCSANAVCCQDNSYGNVISVGCVPVTL